MNSGVLNFFKSIGCEKHPVPKFLGKPPDVDALGISRISVQVFGKGCGENTFCKKGFPRKPLQIKIKKNYLKGV